VTCSVAVGCHRFGGTCCFHLQGEDSSRDWVVMPCSIAVGYQGEIEVA
jgi:hypothetical protein